MSFLVITKQCTTNQLTLTKKGPGIVTAGDIILDHDVEIANPDHVIATLTKSGEINMTLSVRRGRGYQPAATREVYFALSNSNMA